MSKSKSAESGQVDLVEVTLAKPHTHKGQALKAGDPIKVTADQKAWLEKHGVISTQQEDVSNG